MTSEGLPTQGFSAEHREVLPTKGFRPSDSDGLPPSHWFRPSDSEGLPATHWLIAQLAYDRIRRELRRDGLSTDEAERRLHFAALQLTGRRFAELESDHLFALHLEQVIQGNAYPHF